jgi:hypothetical protein
VYDGGKDLLVGPPIFTTTNGFSKGASSACQSVAAKRNATESAWCSAPAVRTWFCKFQSVKGKDHFTIKPYMALYTENKRAAYHIWTRWF